MQLTWKHYIAVALLGFVAYAPTLKVGFLWDDHVIIETNPWIRHWSIQNLRHDFLSDNTQGHGDDYYRPLQATYHRLGYTVFGLHPLGYHLADLLLHLAAGLLLMQLVLQLGFAPMTAWLVGCFFVVHPGGVEQFLITSGVTTPLSYVFTLLCLLCALKVDSWGAAFTSVFCFACALGTKEIAIITPALVLIVFLYQDMPLRRYRILVPMILITGIYLGLRHHAVQIQGQFPMSLLWIFGVKAFGRILLHYVALILCPWNLHSHRLMPPLLHAWPLIDAAWVGLATALIVTKNKTGLFCLAWFVLNLLPTTVAMMAGGFMIDHWSYQANLGVLLPLAIFFTHAWENHADAIHYLSAMLVFPLIIGWAALVHLNVELRGTDEKLYRWALHFTTSRPIEYNLGILLLQTGRPVEAFPYLEDVRAYYPDDVNDLHALALAYWETGHFWLAHDMLKKLVLSHPEFQPAQQSLRVMELSPHVQRRPGENIPPMDLKTAQ